MKSNFTKTVSLILFSMLLMVTFQNCASTVQVNSTAKAAIHTDNTDSDRVMISSIWE